MKIVAPPGAEVILLAGACGPDGYLFANEKMEWSIAPGSVGHFVTHLQRGPFDFISNSTTAQKIDNTYTVNVTSPRNYVLSRGTAHQTDDVRVGKGQAWVSLTSPIEGTSHITAYAPGIPTWETRKSTSTVFWIDASWTFPPPATNAVGTRHTFTTTVNRHSDGRPAIGYRVRYEIVPGGPSAGFAPSGQQVLEVKTDELGQASVEIFQTQPAPGTNIVNVQIIRPENLPGVELSERFVVASGTTQKTWTAPQLSIEKTGPNQAAVGANLAYKYVIRNPAGTAARDVVVTEPVSPGLTLVSSFPQANTPAGQYEWRLGEIPSGETRTIDATFRATQPGAVNACATVRSAEGATSQDCVATTIIAPSIGLDVTGPAEGAVGSDANYEIVVTNRTTAATNDLVVVNRFPTGFTHSAGKNPIEYPLGPLAPGESKRVPIAFRITQPGQQCQTVEVQNGARQVLATKDVCLNASGAAAPIPPATGQAAIEVKKTAVGGLRKEIGDTTTFRIEVTNKSAFAVTGVQITDNYDTSLRPTFATSGYGLVGRDLVWKLSDLPAGRSQVFEVVTECVAASPQACNRVSVVTQQGGSGSANACVEIVQAERRLAVSVVPGRPNLKIGETGVFNVTVTNLGSQLQSNVVMAATVSPEAAPIEEMTVGPADRTVLAPNVEFRPILNLPPGESKQYRIGVRGVRVGTATIEANSRSDSNPVPVRATSSMSVGTSPGQGAPQ